MGKFIIGWVDDPEQLVEFKSAHEADYEAEEWVCVEASSLAEAKAGYEAAFTAWQGSHSKGLVCTFCLDSYGKREPAIALAAQHSCGMNQDGMNVGGVPTYEFHPVCEDHLSTWNDRECEEYFLAYEIGTMVEVAPSRTLV
ncbi:MAG: hypothetical protein ACW99G_11670 [Candidatus Thorarchaeota archaeon]|jgi:hypothetical protein